MDGFLLSRADRTSAHVRCAARYDTAAAAVAALANGDTELIVGALPFDPAASCRADRPGIVGVHGRPVAARHRSRPPARTPHATKSPTPPSTWRGCGPSSTGCARAPCARWWPHAACSLAADTPIIRRSVGRENDSPESHRERVRRRPLRGRRGLPRTQPRRREPRSAAQPARATRHLPSPRRNSPAARRSGGRREGRSRPAGVDEEPGRARVRHRLDQGGPGAALHRADRPGLPGTDRARPRCGISRPRSKACCATASTSASSLAILLHPTPAVCGTPTDLALATIRRRRGGSAVLRRRGRVVRRRRRRRLGGGHPLRRDRRGRTRGTATAGGGIVAESDPESELDETTTKLRTLLRALGVQQSL